MTRLACFKAYDIRGRIDDDLTEDLAFRLGGAVAAVLGPRQVVIGRDARASSPILAAALASGLSRRGVEVLDLGLCGTEEVYFATDHFAAGAGIMVTASHNPIEYNGFKIVGAGARPLPDAEFRAIEAATAEGPTGPGNATTPGQIREVGCRDAYVDRVTGFVDPPALARLHILANAGNGAAGPTFDAVMDGLVARGAPLRVTRMHHAPDPGFPNGIPNPLLPENQPPTAEAVRACGADFGVAWDGDFDRCFFFDGAGSFVPGEYVVGLLAQCLLARSPGARIVHDPRVMWNTRRLVRAAGGEAVVSRTGHALVKARMREVDAIYGGEMSAHHYFREFMYCDSGMIPWVLVAAQISATGLALRSSVAEMRRLHPSSGEINFRVEDPEAATDRVLGAYGGLAQEVDRLDGLSLGFETWRLNLRSSNTEPLLRLNVEALGNPDLIATRVGEIGALLSRSRVDADRNEFAAKLT